MLRRFKDWRIRRKLRRHGLAEPTWIIRPADRGQLTLPTNVRAPFEGVGGLHPVSDEMLEDAPELEALIRKRLRRKYARYVAFDPDA